VDGTPHPQRDRLAGGRGILAARPEATEYLQFYLLFRISCAINPVLYLRIITHSHDAKQGNEQHPIPAKGLGMVMDINTQDVAIGVKPVNSGKEALALLVSQGDLGLKKLVDFMLCFLALLLLFPLFLLIALIIRLDSKGPVLFKTLRIGRGRQRFHMYKFRTMHPEAEEMLKAHPAYKKQFTRKFKLSDDWRVTRVGGFLRRTGLDELPQLVNILKGDMTLVGPRPLLPEELEHPQAQERFNVAPGLTGLWQIKGKNAVTYPQKSRLDRFYALKRNLVLDLKIILATIPAIVKGKGFL
jgi:lipopolysaccharide/colanic/teichoic acid biosynthesis glycosyltransferase